MIIPCTTIITTIGLEKKDEGLFISKKAENTSLAMKVLTCTETGYKVIV